MIGYGYKPYFVTGDDPALVHQQLAATLDTVLDEIREIQTAARSGKSERRGPALADDRPSNAQGLDRPEGRRRQAGRGNVALAPGPDGRGPDQRRATASCSRAGCAATSPRSCSTRRARFRPELAALAPDGRAPHGRQPARQRRPAPARADHAGLPRVRRRRAQAGRLARRGDVRGRHVRARRHGQERRQLPDVRPRRDGLEPLPGDLRSHRQGLGRRGDPRRTPRTTSSRSTAA